MRLQHSPNVNKNAWVILNLFYLYIDKVEFFLHISDNFHFNIYEYAVEYLFSKQNYISKTYEYKDWISLPLEVTTITDYELYKMTFLEHLNT